MNQSVECVPLEVHCVEKFLFRQCLKRSWNVTVVTGIFHRVRIGPLTVFQQTALSPETPIEKTPQNSAAINRYLLDGQAESPPEEVP